MIRKRVATAARLRTCAGRRAYTAPILASSRDALDRPRGGSATPAKSTPDDPQREIGELLLQIADDLRAMLTAANAVAGLSELEGRALRYLAAATPQRELATLLRCDAPRVSQIVTRLVTKGLVRRKVGGDRRTRVVVPTPAGLDVLERAGAVLRARSPILHRLDREQRQQLYDLLRAMRVDER